MHPEARHSGGYLDNLGHMLRALRGRNYALFFSGHGLSLIGTQTQQAALSLLVWEITHKEFWLGRVAFAVQIFGLVMAPLAGVLSDRFNRRRLLLGTQSLSMLQATILAVLTLTGMLQLWHVIVAAAFLGLIFSVDIPTRQAFVVEIVSRRDEMPNAIALNSFIFNGARIVGPSIAAAIILEVKRRFVQPYAGHGACFVFNAVSYLTVLLALLAMRLTAQPAPRKHPHVLRSLREGFAHAMGSVPIRSVLAMLAVVSFLGTPFFVLAPAMADRVLHAGREEITLIALGGWRVPLRLEATTGVLLASSGAGALLGALFLASRRSVAGLTRIIPVATAAMAVGMVGFSLSPWVLGSIPLLVMMGFGFMVQMASGNTVIQTVVDDDKRGRVMSFFMMTFMATAPFSSLLAGSLASRIGPDWTLFYCGLGLVAATAVFAARVAAMNRAMHPIFVRMGILSQSPAVPPEAVRADIIPPNDAPDGEAANEPPDADSGE